MAQVRVLWYPRCISRAAFHSLLSGPSLPPIPPTSDWRVGLCITTGCADLSKEVVVFDERQLEEQLDAACMALLAGHVKIDTSPPSLLYNSPSIILPRPLASILLPALTASISLSSHSTNTPADKVDTAPSMLDDPNAWLPQLLRYFPNSVVASLQELRTQKNKIHVFFSAPNFSSFSFLQLSSIAPLTTPVLIEERCAPRLNESNSDTGAKPSSPIQLQPRSISTDGAFSSPKSSFTDRGQLDMMKDRKSDEANDMASRNTFTATVKPPIPPKSKKVDISQLRATLTAAPAESEEAKVSDSIVEEVSPRHHKRGMFSWKTKKKKS